MGARCGGSTVCTSVPVPVHCFSQASISPQKLRCPLPLPRTNALLSAVNFTFIASPLGAPEDVCQTPGSRGPKPSASNAAGAGGAAVGPPPRSPFVGKPAPRSGGGGGGGKTTAAAARGQTKLSTFFPMVDTNSRDSDGSAGGAACSGPLGVASAAERAAAAAAAAINGAPGGLALGQGGVGVSAAGAGAGARQLAAVAESVAAEQAAVLQQRLEAKDREVRELQEQLRWVTALS